MSAEQTSWTICRDCQQAWPTETLRDGDHEGCNCDRGSGTYHFQTIEAQPILDEMKDLEAEWETAESERKQVVAEREQMFHVIDRMKTEGWREIRSDTMEEAREIERQAGRNQPKDGT